MGSQVCARQIEAAASLLVSLESSASFGIVSPSHLVMGAAKLVGALALIGVTLLFILPTSMQLVSCATCVHAFVVRSSRRTALCWVGRWHRQQQAAQPGCVLGTQVLGSKSSINRAGGYEGSQHVRLAP